MIKTKVCPLCDHNLVIGEEDIKILKGNSYHSHCFKDIESLINTSKKLETLPKEHIKAHLNELKIVNSLFKDEFVTKILNTLTKKAKTHLALLKIVKQAKKNGTIKCPKCFNLLEPDTENCFCGWENPLILIGLI